MAYSHYSHQDTSASSFIEIVGRPASTHPSTVRDARWARQVDTSKNLKRLDFQAQMHSGDLDNPPPFRLVERLDRHTIDSDEPGSGVYKSGANLM